MEPISSLQIQHILVPCDFSPHSTEVLKYGCDLARRYNATLTLFHVYEPPTYAVPPDGALLATPETLATQIEEVMDSLSEIKKAVEQSGVTTVHTKVAQGMPAAEIIQESLEGHYQLLVMGTHGRTGLQHVLMGSVAEKVVRKSDCPVLTIRTKVA